MGCTGSKPAGARPVVHVHRRPPPVIATGAPRCAHPVVRKTTLESFDARTKYSHHPVGQDFIVETDDTKVLGIGLSGPVRRCTNRFTGQECALKVLQKQGLAECQLDDLRHEVNNYLKVDHPNIARLLHVYEDDETVSLVMELCKGKELFDRLAEKPLRRYPEREAQQACYQALLAVAYLHWHNIVHCDIKLENLMCESSEDATSIKLIDFGLSKLWDKQGNLTKAQGTVGYTAPEVFAESFTDKCDMWSLGVVVFMLLGGSPPFPMRDQVEGKKRILAGRWSFNESKWHGVSWQARDFVSRLLVVDPTERMSANEALEHPWMQAMDLEVRIEVDASHAVDTTKLLDEFRIYGRNSRLKRAVLAVMAHHYSNTDLKKIVQTFKYLDKDHSGTITRANFTEAFGDMVDISEGERLFDSLSLDHDGEIHYSEFLAAVMQNQVGMDEDLLRDAFGRLDVSKTSVISVSDLAIVLGEFGFDNVDVSTLISECPGCTPATGISYQQLCDFMTQDEAGSKAPLHRSIEKCPTAGSLDSTVPPSSGVPPMASFDSITPMSSQWRDASPTSGTDEYGRWFEVVI